MKRQIFYVIVAYAGWLTYQDINGTLQDTHAEAAQPLLRQMVAEQVGDAQSIAAYRAEPASAECVDSYRCEGKERTHGRMD